MRGEQIKKIRDMAKGGASLIAIAAQVGLEIGDVQSALTLGTLEAATAADSSVQDIPAFQPGAFYLGGYVIQQNGVLYARVSPGTSGASFAADAANWTPLGSSSELGVAEISAGSPVSPFVNSNGAIPIPGLSVTVVTGARPVSVEVDVHVQVITNSQTLGIVYLFEDGVQVEERPFTVVANAQFYGTAVRFSSRRNPAPGSHTYAVYGSTGTVANTWWALGSNTAGSQTRSRIAVVQR